MMTKDQQLVVTKVYRKFYELEVAEKKWSDIDENMYLLDWISDDQLIIEAKTLQNKLSNTEFYYKQTYNISKEMVPVIMESIIYIVDLYNETKFLHINNKFILQYFLALYHVGALRN